MITDLRDRIAIPVPAKKERLELKTGGKKLETVPLSGQIVEVCICTLHTCTGTPDSQKKKKKKKRRRRKKQSANVLNTTSKHKGDKQRLNNRAIQHNMDSFGTDDLDSSTGDG